MDTRSGGNTEDRDPSRAEKDRPRVLLVDDEEDARLTLRLLLETEGFEVHEAEGGHEAVKTLREDSGFSVVILDLQMPRMNGRQVLSFIRGSNETAGLPVLVRTGSASAQAEAELMDAGADDFVAKSMDSTRLVARVKRLIGPSSL